MCFLGSDMLAKIYSKNNFYSQILYYLSKITQIHISPHLVIEVYVLTYMIKEDISNRLVLMPVVDNVVELIPDLTVYLVQGGHLSKDHLDILGIQNGTSGLILSLYLFFKYLRRKDTGYNLELLQHLHCIENQIFLSNRPLQYTFSQSYFLNTYIQLPRRFKNIKL